MAELTISGLRKWFHGSTGRVNALDSIDLKVDAGEMLVLLGPSGCGKTTLLRCLAGLEEAQEGAILLAGQPVFDAARRLDVPTHRRDIGMVFQNYSLWPHMKIRRNVEYPLRARRFPARERAERAREVLELVQCDHLADRLPSMLSGGQQQRVALARALASRPSLMLLDEPLSNLDALLREELRGHLRSLHRELGFTAIYVTHDQTEAFTLGTSVAVMNAGRIEQIGTAGEVNARPASEYVARFLGIRNSLELTRRAQWASVAGPIRGDLDALPSLTGPITLYVRPEDVLMVNTGTEPPDRTLSLSDCRVVDFVTVGHETSYVVNLGEATFHVRRPGAAVWQPGDQIDVHLPCDDVLLYRDGGLIPDWPSRHGEGSGDFRSSRETVQTIYESKGNIGHG